MLTLSSSPAVAVSPPIHDGGRVVGEGRLVFRIDQFTDVKIRVALKTFVGKQLYHLLEGEFSFDVFRRASCLNGVVGSLRYGVEEPIDLLFFRGRVERVVVGDLGDQFFEEVNVGGDVGPMDMPDVFDSCF